jgi:ribosome-dependent ATPase
MAGKGPAPAVRLSGVEHRYRKETALAGVSLTLPSGRLSGLIGPDGVGKSTLLGLIAGVKRLQTGQVEVLGRDQANAAERRQLTHRIAYMPQGLGRNLYATLSVQENLDFFGRLFGLDADERYARISELTAATGLAEFTGRQAMNLSGGMKQKLGLGCALIQEPNLLILDEPTTGVDPLSRRRFWELIDQLRTRQPNLSVLVSTAYMEEAERFEYLAVVDAGRVLASGSPADLRERTGEQDMESVYVALLPIGLRHQRPDLELVPRRSQGDDPPAIEARELTRRFGDFTAVDRVSLEIHKGEIFGFLGSNGSGKTTTMRMLTGLLPLSGGEARVFGRPVDGNDPRLRHRLGFMSQSFSLYGELTVRQNLDLHGRLYQLPLPQLVRRMSELTDRFGLGQHMESRTEELPLGVRQRLSLAVAVIHEPELLILDEPTSGVDPVARDGFWELLLELSRERGVTIFISTHFMNEAERCDRISLMHAGRVLAQGSPQALKKAQQAITLEDAFIGYLEREMAGGSGLPEAEDTAVPSAVEEIPSDLAAGSDEKDRRSPKGFHSIRALVTSRRQTLGARSMPPLIEPAGGFSLGRLWAYTRRESIELARDPIRLAFALLGPIFLLIAMGYGMSFDVDEISYAVMDWDRTPASRAYLEHFAGSAWFKQQPPLADDASLLRRLRSGDLTLAIEIPPGFGRDLKRGDTPEVAFWIDGAIPFRGDTMRGYIEGVHRLYLQELSHGASSESATGPSLRIETRFRYNQAFRSLYAMVPGIIMLLLIMIPATMTAVGVVREKELGTMANFYATPTTPSEFLLGKQLPYVGLALLSYLSLLIMALLLFRVPLKGEAAALSLGAFLFVFAGTGLGLLMSTFMRTQIAAVFGTAIASVIPTLLFSGLLVPVASLTGPARIMGYGFPSAWFHHVSVGTFTKGLGLGDLWPDYLALAGFGLGFFVLGRTLLRTQER